MKYLEIVFVGIWSVFCENGRVDFDVEFQSLLVN